MEKKIEEEKKVKNELTYEQAKYNNRELRMNN